MKNKSPITVLLISLLLSLAVFFVLLYNADPRQGIVVIALFVGSICLSIFAGVSLVAYGFRRLLNKSEKLGSELKNSMREGLLSALYAGAILGLAGIQLLSWWDAGLLALSLLLFEVYFSSGREQKL
jgi:predicted permease